jgi:tetratricopeptide (TPR) repeat protein
MRRCLLLALSAVLSAASPELELARDKEDRAALEKLVNEFQTKAGQHPSDPNALYQLALALSYQAEVATEVKDKGQAQRAAEAGVKTAEKAIQLNPGNAEYHRIHGTLCGQVIPANPLLGAMRYGKCAKESIDKAIAIDPKSPLAHLSRGIGNYYLPAHFGGGPELAVKDFDEAIRLDPKSADAHLWRGIALRKLNRNAEAHQELAKSVQLNPQRIWAKQQLDKTPAK